MIVENSFDNEELNSIGNLCELDQLAVIKNRMEYLKWKYDEIKAKLVAGTCSRESETYWADVKVRYFHKIDTERFKADHPQLAKEYEKVSESVAVYIRTKK